MRFVFGATSAKPDLPIGGQGGGQAGGQCEAWMLIVFLLLWPVSLHYLFAFKGVFSYETICAASVVIVATVLIVQSVDSKAR